MVFESKLSQTLKGTGKICTVCVKTSSLLTNQKFIQHYNIAKFHNGVPLKTKNYYDVLEVTPKATKNQLKKAYYKLSMTYHPDQNKEEAAAVRFREITEAYEILGDVNKRRLYDKGIFGLGSASSPEEAETYSRTVRSTQFGKSKAPAMTGRTPIYDFDEWSKRHYKDNLEKKREAKVEYERLIYERQLMKEDKKNSRIVSFILLLLAGLGFSYGIAIDEDTIEVP